MLMKLLNNMRSYLLEEEFALHVYPGKINVVNYKSIGHFDSNKVILYHEKGMIEIKGKNLVVSKLLEDEVLVLGVVENIEFR